MSESESVFLSANTPRFWLHWPLCQRQSGGELERRFDDLVRQGWGGIVLYPAADTTLPYLSSVWMDTVRDIVLEASRRGLRVWLGEIGGEYRISAAARIADQNPDFRLSALEVAEMIDLTEEEARSSVYRFDWPADVVVGVTSEGETRQLDLIHQPASDGQFVYSLSSDYVQLIAFAENAVMPQSSYVLDLYNPQAVAETVEYLYQQYKEGLGETISRIERIFWDIAPGELNPVHIPWSRAIAQRFQRSFGYEAESVLPHLFPNEQSNGELHRSRFFSVLTDLLNEAYLKSVMEVNPVQADTERPLYTGNAFLLSWSGRPDFALWNPASSLEKDAFLPASLVSSSARWWGKPSALSPYFSTAPFSQVEDVAHQLEVQAGVGISSFVFASPAPPPNLPATGFPDAVRFALDDLSSRLHAIKDLRALLLFPIRTVWADLGHLPLGDPAVLGYAKLLSDVGEQIHEQGCAFDWLPEELLPHLRINAQRQFAYTLPEAGARTFSVLMIPFCRLLLAASFDALEHLATQGGSIVFIGFVPNAAQEHGNTPELDERMQRLLEIENVRWLQDDLPVAAAEIIAPLLPRSDEAAPQPLEHKTPAQTIGLGDEFFFFARQNNIYPLTHWSFAMSECHAVAYSTPFWTREFRCPVWLNVENLGAGEGSLHVILNGSRMEWEEDTPSGRLDLSASIWMGENKLTLLLEHGSAARMPARLWLEGDFAVERIDDREVIAIPKNTVQVGPLERQGYPHYTGESVYRQKITLAEDTANRNVTLRFTEIHDPVKIAINDQECGTLWRSPWRKEITRYLRPGENLFELTLSHTRTQSSGLLGPVVLEVFERVL